MTSRVLSLPHDFTPTITSFQSSISASRRLSQAFRVLSLPHADYLRWRRRGLSVRKLGMLANGSRIARELDLEEWTSRTETADVLHEPSCAYFVDAFILILIGIVAVKLSVAIWTRSHQQDDVKNYKAKVPKTNADIHDINSDLVLEDLKDASTDFEFSFLAKIAIALGIAAIVTIVSIGVERPAIGSSLGFQFLSDSSSPSVMAIAPVGFTFKAFGYRIALPEYAPGWIYFLLLMATACGLFISEEALNIWVGISIARMLTLDGSWKSLAESFSRNAGYITLMIFWVYWGVCISDLIPFYFGKLFKQSGAFDDVCSKLGIGKEKALSITRVVKKYGNLIGFVERFSVGVRNPTAFLAGASGISAECFFVGVCGGGLVTLPIQFKQLGIGCLMRERPLFSLATSATVVGIWTIFPYTVAASTTLFLYLQCRYSS
ncbi:uncharacterized protein LOC133814214 [Humulus lupulus]|uniref:uncharacterized protein LOC133814214 n=1 Tax=Humulus lupulus TaxID=3486 RepID=UPI002B40BEA5|nr:uncharacterized protein LOC133814214 [Humulus lupulus]